MIISAHIIVGGVVGEIIDKPIWAFLVGMVLHFVLDSIPHYDRVEGECWGKKQIIFTTIDTLLTLSLIFLIIKLPLDRTILNNSFAWGALGGIFPDLLDNVPFWQKKFRSYKFGYYFNQIHYKIQPKQPSIFLGLLTQAVVIFGALFVHFYFVK